MSVSVSPFRFGYQYFPSWSLLHGSQGLICGADSCPDVRWHLRLLLLLLGLGLARRVTSCLDDSGLSPSLSLTGVLLSPLGFILIVCALVVLLPGVPSVDLSGSFLSW